MNSLRAIDLNLLVILDALLAERHVSRAATRLNMSQPAVSHALARLRLLFDDPLLIRRGGQLVASSKALEIAPTLSEALRQVGQVFGPSGFDPRQEKRTFRLAMSDYGSAVILPSLMRQLRSEAPSIDLVITQSSREGMLRLVQDGDCDLALGVFSTLPERLVVGQLTVDRFACLADRETMEGKDGLDLQAYLVRPHVLVAMQDGGDTEIDRALRAIGCQRHIAVTLPHWGNAARLIHQTDLVLTVARNALAFHEGDPSFVVFTPPFAIPPFPFVQVWHERRNGDLAHLWLRNAVASVARSLPLSRRLPSS
jgi:DNA-binding transcriptional LysR family regulator